LEVIDGNVLVVVDDGSGAAFIVDNEIKLKTGEEKWKSLSGDAVIVVLDGSGAVFLLDSLSLKRCGCCWQQSSHCCHQWW